MNQGLLSGFGQPAVDPSKVIDLTNAGEDYLLRIGETARINYSASTNVLLHIATEEGQYELTIIGDQTGSIGTLGTGYLKPNNVVLSAGAVNFASVEQIMSYTNSAGASTPTGYKDGVSFTGFHMGLYSLMLHLEAKISTFTKTKSIHSNFTRRDSSTQLDMETAFELWEDTTTPWTSLGTITFPFAQSGAIIVKRII